MIPLAFVRSHIAEQRPCVLAVRPFPLTPPQHLLPMLRVRSLTGLTGTGPCSSDSLFPALVSFRGSGSRRPFRGRLPGGPFFPQGFSLSKAPACVGPHIHGGAQRLRAGEWLGGCAGAPPFDTWGHAAPTEGVLRRAPRWHYPLSIYARSLPRTSRLRSTGNGSALPEALCVFDARRFESCRKGRTQNLRQ